MEVIPEDRHVFDTRITLSLGSLCLLMLIAQLTDTNSLPLGERWLFAIMGIGGVTLCLAMLYVNHRIDIYHQFKEEFTRKPTIYEPIDPDELATYRRGQFVYVLQDVDVTGYCKIGRTIDLPQRITRFEVNLPFKVSVLAIIPCDDNITEESRLHKRYALKRIQKSEWFILTADDVDYLKSLSLTPTDLQYLLSVKEL